MQGVIIKGISGFYYVKTSGGIIECRGRGNLRTGDFVPLAGDRVVITPSENGKGVVEELLPRKNFFGRPPVANVDTVVLVVAARKPDPAYLTLDKFTVAVKKSGAELVICLNKTDLVDTEFVESFKDCYSRVAEVFPVSAKSCTGISELKAALKGKQVALAGPSGCGKSSLTNILVPSASSLTGEISRRTSRGKNTTRHTELFDAGDFMLFDTPGFTSFDIFDVDRAELSRLFEDFSDYSGCCRFDDCAHLGEPDCGIKAAVLAGKISPGRYESYKAIYKELETRERQKY